MLSLPLEIHEHILGFARPADVSSASQTCRFIYHRINHSTHLWRLLFLAQDFFDDPRLTEDYTSAFDWRQELQLRVRFLNVCRSKPERVSKGDIRQAITTFITLLTTFIPRYPTRSRFWDGPISDLHEGLASLANDECNDILLHLDAYILRPISGSVAEHRLFIYDLHNHEYGPGPITSVAPRSRSVSWRLIYHIRRHIHHVCSTDCPVPRCLEDARPYSGPHSQKDGDWAAVGGSWVGYFVFLDGDDFFTYNFSSPTDGDLDSETLSDAETVRRCHWQFDVTGFKRVANSSRPKIVFRSDRSKPGTYSMHGTVELMPDGKTLEWNMTLRINQRTSWRWCGIQLAVGSTMGVLGTWYGANSRPDDMGPLGPFWIWKVA